MPSFTYDAQLDKNENTTAQLNAHNLSDALQDELEEFDAVMHEEDQIYQRNFFILRVLIFHFCVKLICLIQILVRGGVITTLVLLSVAFGYVFISNWNMYEMSIFPKPSETKM